jgi:hypothetical protein
MTFNPSIKTENIHVSVESIDRFDTDASSNKVLAYFLVPITIVTGSSFQAQTAEIVKDERNTSCHSYQLPAYHSMMLDLSREDGFPYLLNSLGLTGIAAEIGVRNGELAIEMLEKWNGKRYLLQITFNLFFQLIIY